MTLSLELTLLQEESNVYAWSVVITCSMIQYLQEPYLGNSVFRWPCCLMKTDKFPELVINFYQTINFRVVQIESICRRHI